MSDVPGPASPADGFLLRRGRVVDSSTGTATEPVDLRVADGRVVAIGARARPVRGDEVVDLGGRWVVPGLWDAHTHMTQWALARQRLDVSAATSAAQAAALVTERLRTDPPLAGVPLVGSGFRDAMWGDEPTADLLDSAVAASGSDTPVVLVSGDLHCGWLSTAAARRFGVGGDAKTGGLLREHPWFAVLDRLGEMPEPVEDARVGRAAAAAATRGVVGVVDFERSSTVVSWTRRAAAGRLDLRVVCAVWPEDLEAAVGRGLRTGDPLGPMLTVGPVKVISDGSLNTRTAYCHDPYPGLAGPGARGQLSVPPEELVPLLARAAEAGFEGAVHAIGDLANTLALDAFEATGARGSIEHAQLLTDADVTRLAALGLTASVQPEHAMDDRDVADRHWAGRTARAFPFAAMLRAGVRLALGSDAPVAPLDPWFAISAAVERARDGREPWHPEQRLPAAAALAASTRGRATVRPGDVADLAVLDADPLSARGSDLRHMGVAATMVAGRWSHVAL